jgi:hypothetical protein
MNPPRTNRRGFMFLGSAGRLLGKHPNFKM